MKQLLFITILMFQSSWAYTQTFSEVIARIANFRDVMETPIGTPNEASIACYNVVAMNHYLTQINKTVLANLTAGDPQPLRQIVEPLFLTRIATRDRIKDLSLINLDAKSCLRDIRTFFRISRFIEEYVSEQNSSDAIPKVFEGQSPSLMINPDFESSNLRSGDILLSRGNAVVSASIARIGDDDGQFSHIALVYVDPNTQQVYTIEAHIEIGVVVTPIEKYLTDGKVRAVIYRHPNAQLAHLAAQEMYAKVLKASQSSSGNIPYDFGMNLGNDKEIFCSEVASLGYKLAAENLGLSPLTIPMFKTQITMKNRDFLNDIGVTAVETFAPTDIDIDPRFALVAEWRDLSKTQDARFLDAILTSIYDWMESHNYVFDNTIIDITKSSLGWSARKTFLFSPLLKDKFPTNMKWTALNAMISLGDVGSKLLSVTQSANITEIQKSGLPLTHFQVKEQLNELRRKDLLLYQNKLPSMKTPLFHKRFHPKGESIWDSIPGL